MYTAILETKMRQTLGRTGPNPPFSVVDAKRESGATYGA